MLNIFADNEKISARQIFDYSYCPRYFYLKHKEEISSETDEDGIKKEFLYKFFKELLKKEHKIIKTISNPKSKEKTLETYKSHSLQLIEKNMPEEEINYIEKAKSDLKDEIDSILINNLEMRSFKVSTMARTYEKEGKELADKICPIKPKEVELESEKLELTAELDLIDLNGEDYIPNIIKIGKKPDKKTWNSYKNQLKAISLLMEEDLGKETNVGVLRYPIFLDKEPIVLNNKEEVLEIKKDIKDIMDNKKEPEKQENCNDCELSTEC